MRRGKRQEGMGGERRKKEGKGRGKGGRGLRRGPLRILAGGPECEVTPLSTTKFSVVNNVIYQLFLNNLKPLQKT